MKNISGFAHLTRLTINEIATTYRVPLSAVQLWVSTGLLPSTRQSDAPQSAYLIARLDVELFLSSEKAGRHQRKPVLVGIADLAVLPEFQLRACTSQEKVAEYAAAFKNGAVFPPITAAKLGSYNPVLDGFHRIAAQKRLIEQGFRPILKEDQHHQFDTIWVNFVENITVAEALHVCATANLKNGFHLSLRDKMKAARVLVSLPENQKLSSRQMGAITGVSHKQIQILRREYLGIAPPPKPIAPATQADSLRDIATGHLQTAVRAWEKLEPDTGNKLRAIFSEVKGGSHEQGK
ncbi:hypothetical protein [Ereboglobus luteus]|uniref:ParB/Sulfiredoxin domain-containing protein n=1 Tax=Ereboglobus luteus TaxID=1796921 RepID=A0A2U8E216_9BACT|nr:hypothetical protein [Ereboglobus luteus]AWI08734.1 hypothetical protein CKA38_05220 [Ereboglobus luteus]